MHIPSTSTCKYPIKFPLFNYTLLSSVRIDGSIPDPHEEVKIIGGSIPDPHEEFRFLEMFTIRSKGSLIRIDQSYIANMCSKWLWDDCKKQIMHVSCQWRIFGGWYHERLSACCR